MDGERRVCWLFGWRGEGVLAVWMERGGKRQPVEVAGFAWNVMGRFAGGECRTASWSFYSLGCEIVGLDGVGG